MIFITNRQAYSVPDQFNDLDKADIAKDFVSTPLYIPSSYYTIEWNQDRMEWIVLEMEIFQINDN